MAQEWVYTRDGKAKSGPVSMADLQALAKSGRIRPTDMLRKEGMSQWVPASRIKGLFDHPTVVRPPSRAPARSEHDRAVAEDDAIRSSRIPGTPQQEGEPSLAPRVLMARWSLGLAILLSLLGAVCAVAGFGGEVLGPIVAGMAVFLGLVAVAVGVSARQTRSFLASGGTAVFVGLAALLFSIGTALLTRTINDARETVAQASAVEDDQKAAEEAKQQAKTERRKADEAKDQAQTILDQVRTAPQQILDEARRKGAEVEAASNALQKERADLEAEKTAFSGRKAALDKDQDEVVEAKRKVKDAQQKVDDAQHDLDKKTKDLKTPTELADNAAKDKMQADKSRIEAQTLMDKTKEKEQEAADHLKKVTDIYDELKKKLAPNGFSGHNA